RHAMRPADIARPDAGREAVVHAVGPGEGLVLVREPLDGDDRTEDLPLDDLRVLLRVRDHRGRVVEPLVAHRLAAGEDLGSGLLGALDAPLDALELFLRDD